MKGFPAHVTALTANARKINNAVEKYVKLQNYVALLLFFFYFAFNAITLTCAPNSGGG